MGNAEVCVLCVCVFVCDPSFFENWATTWYDVANPARDQLNKEENNISLSPSTPENLVSRHKLITGREVGNLGR